MTLVPTVEVMETPPLLDPELVIVPVWLTVVVVSVMAFEVALLLLIVKLPVPDTPPETVRMVVPEELVKVVPLLFTVRAPAMVGAEVVLF